MQKATLLQGPYPFLGVLKNELHLPQDIYLLENSSRVYILQSNQLGFRLKILAISRFVKAFNTCGLHCETLRICIVQKIDRFHSKLVSLSLSLALTNA